MKTRSLALLICNVSIIALFIFLVGFWNANQVHAAVITWEGDESNLWSVDGNWSGGTAPSTGDIATFDGTGNTACTIDATISVAGIDMNSGYTNVITQAAAITIGSSHFDIASGTFSGGSQAIDLNGNMVISGGTYQATSGSMTITGTWTKTGGTFTHNSGSVVMDGSATTFNVDTDTFYNFTADSGGSGSWLNLGAGDTLFTEGALYIKRGFLGNGAYSFNASGDVTLGASVGAMAFPMTFTGTGNQVLIDEGGTWAAAVTINKPVSGTVSLGSDFSTTSQYTITDGIVDFTSGGYDFSVNRITMNGGSFTGGAGNITLSSIFTLAGGTFTAPSGTMDVSGNWTHSAGGEFVHNNGSVVLRGGTITYDDLRTGAGEFYNLEIDTGGSGSWFYPNGSGADTIIAYNDLNLARGYLGSAGNFTVGGGSHHW